MAQVPKSTLSTTQRSITQAQIDSLLSEILKAPAPAPHPELTPRPVYSAIWKLPVREVIPYFLQNANWTNTKHFCEELYDRYWYRFVRERVGNTKPEPTVNIIRLFPICGTAFLLYLMPLKLRYGFSKKDIYD